MEALEAFIQTQRSLLARTQSDIERLRTLKLDVIEDPQDFVDNLGEKVRSNRIRRCLSLTGISGRRRSLTPLLSVSASRRITDSIFRRKFSGGRLEGMVRSLSPPFLLFFRMLMYVLFFAPLCRHFTPPTFTSQTPRDQPAPHTSLQNSNIRTFLCPTARQRGKETNNRPRPRPLPSPISMYLGRRARRTNRSRNTQTPTRA